MARIVNRGFLVTLVAIMIVAEIGIRAIVTAPPKVVRVAYGTTLAMYMAVESRLRASAPEVQVLALGDSLAMTQFQPDVYAADHGLPAGAVFNAAYLAQTYRSQEMLLNKVGLDRMPKLKQVLMFVNPRRLTIEGNVDAPVFRVVMDPYSRLYGLSRYLVMASWRQVAKPTSWDEVEYLSAHGGVVFDHPRPTGDYPVNLYALIDQISDEYLTDLKRVVEMFRARGIQVFILQGTRHPSVHQFVNAGVEADFDVKMHDLSAQTGAEFIPLAAVGFQPPADTDYLDYGHLNRSGGTAFTHFLRDTIPPIE